MNENIKNKQIKFVAIYVRVSTSNQEKQDTIQNQIMVLEEYSAKNGYIIVERYVDEGWSGDTLVRPSLDRMRLDARERKWDAVLIYDPDRLARRYSYQELVIDELAEKDIPVIFLTVPLPTNEEDRLLYGVKGIFSQYERFKIAERFRLGKLRTVREGHVITNAPYGYKHIRKNKEAGITHGYYEINEDEARVIRMIFSWIADDGETVRGVIRKLKERGIKPRKSKKGVWATSTLSSLLENQAFIGQAHFCKQMSVVPERPHKEEKYRKNKKSSRKRRPEEEWIKIPVPPIIEPDLFWKVRARLESNYELADRNKKNDYLLSGKIWCTCGERRCGSSPLGGENLYYRCNNRIKNFPMPKTCFEKGVNAKMADKLVWNKISKIMSSPELLSAQVERWMNENTGKEKTSYSDIDVMKKEISLLVEKEDRYNKAYGDGVFSIGKLKEYVTPLREKILSLERQVAKCKQDQEEISLAVPSPYEMQDFAKQAIEALRKLNFEKKRAIVMNIVDKVVATQEKLQVYGYIPINNQINQNESLCSKHRHRRTAKCREIDTFQRSHKKQRSGRELSVLHD